MQVISSPVDATDSTGALNLPKLKLNLKFIKQRDTYNEIFSRVKLNVESSYHMKKKH